MNNFFPKNRKGYFYSLDAFIALLIIFGVVLFIRPSSTQPQYESYVHEDILFVLSNLKIGEINNNYVKNLIIGGEITNLNQSVLDQIGEFYVNASSSKDTELAQNILDNLSLNENLGIYFGDKLVANSNSSSIDSANSISTSRQIISGIQRGESAKGFSSRAFLFAGNRIQYFYFGGYIGDGNITVNINGEVTGCQIEAAFSGDFSLYINEQKVGYYDITPNIPYSIDLSSNVSMFGTGVNNLSFRSSENLYIAGGYVKITYVESQVLTPKIKKYFPGIGGLINIYDSFYVPGTLNSINAFLHYNSSYDVFFTVGNEEIYRGNSSGVDAAIDLDASDFSSLDYSSLSDKTIPYRLGLFNVSYTANFTNQADVFSIVDLSGSMLPGCSVEFSLCCGGWPWWRCDYKKKCEDCGYTWEDKIGEAKTATKLFIDSLLNYSKNRVGLVGYSDKPILESNCHNLSTNSVSLKAKVDYWQADGSTCICCGIISAVNRLVSQSNSSINKSIVVMTDGQANVRCGNAHEDWDGVGGITASDDAIKAACDAYTNYGIRTYAVAFGIADIPDAIHTLEVMSGIDCGHGGFYSGNVSGLIDIYEHISQAIISASYYEQTISGEGIYTKLYPDSYIEIEYDKEIPYGMVVFSETDEFGNNISQGDLYIPDNSVVYEVQAVSYSGSKWTSLVEINSSSGWISVFNLSEYNSSFVELGDPYSVNIPSSLVNYGNNTIRVRTGLEQVLDGGSQYNKIIYSIIKNISSYSPILYSASGCSWHIEFEDGSEEVINAPKNYSGSDNCYYNPTIDSGQPFPYADFKENDAVDYAIASLLSSLDLDYDGRIETKFAENDLGIASTEIEGIPFTWDTEVQARVWI